MKKREKGKNLCNFEDDLKGNSFRTRREREKEKKIKHEAEYRTRLSHFFFFRF